MLYFTTQIRISPLSYQDYLVLAQAISSENIQQWIEYFASIEAELIERPDSGFKFHSGVPP
ncbi:tRNA isopentenyl-2-thiomethyl-A-37 hydroxylase MiaE [Arsenophonus endosymbiont of Bemisia tabaci]|uniref:tRNA isopentenyl-2-thiomethyl-A-37 hydroxylase MiaE n=1 Tax=Arsenophonus endosymbiont of Bemisia tabaci TaxID=536059 RepID=UPI0030B82138